MDFPSGLEFQNKKQFSKMSRQTKRQDEGFLKRQDKALPHCSVAFEKPFSLGIIAISDGTLSTSFGRFNEHDVKEVDKNVADEKKNQKLLEKVS